MPEWNERVHGADELDGLSQTLKVPIIEDATAKSKGEYLIINGEPMILLKPNLKCTDKLWAAYHEIGHHLLHHPVPHRFSKGIKRRMDREANFFAAVALIPTQLIEEKAKEDLSVDEALGAIAEEYNYPKELIAIRKEIYETYRI